MKKSVWFSLMLVSSLGFAEDKTVLSSFLQTAPDAVTGAILLDGPLNAVLWGLGSGSVGSVGSVALGTGAAAVGYSIRKTCNHYGFNGTNSVWCGFLGGSVKYSGKATMAGKFSLAEPVIGAADAGTYEGTAAYRGVWATAEFMAIETGVNALGYLLRPVDPAAPPSSLWAEVKSGAVVGVLVSGFVHTTCEWYGKSVRDGIVSGAKSFAGWLSAQENNRAEDL